MIFVSNPFFLPILVLIWTMDVWLWLVLIRLALHKIRSKPVTEVNQVLAGITDPVTHVAKRCISYLTQRPVPLRLLWIMTFLAVAIARHFALALLISWQQI